MNEYEEQYIKIFNTIGDNRIGVLATHDNSCVSCRSMSFVIVDGLFYFQTDRESFKARQLAIKKDAAIAFDNFEILGEVEELGHPLSENLSKIHALYKTHFASAAKKYSWLDDERLYAFRPSVIKIWEYTEQGAKIVFLTIDKKQFLEKDLLY